MGAWSKSAAIVEGEEEVGAWDDVHRGVLPSKMVEEARKEEIGFMQGRNIWSLRPIEDCWQDTGKAPVTVRWVDANKRGKDEFLIRSRLVARDFEGNDNDRDDVFAGTPPLEPSAPADAVLDDAWADDVAISSSLAVSSGVVHPSLAPWLPSCCKGGLLPWWA